MGALQIYIDDDDDESSLRRSANRCANEFSYTKITNKTTKLH